MLYLLQTQPLVFSEIIQKVSLFDTLDRKVAFLGREARKHLRSRGRGVLILWDISLIIQKVNFSVSGVCNKKLAIVVVMTILTSIPSGVIDH